MAILEHFPTKMFKSETTFPQGFRITKNIGHPTSGSGGKKTFKRYLKSEDTDRRTDTQTDGRTFQLIESMGPEGRCFENHTKDKVVNVSNDRPMDQPRDN